MFLYASISNILSAKGTNTVSPSATRLKASSIPFMALGVIPGWEKEASGSRKLSTVPLS